ncbi:MAG: hypothetical protein DMF69_09195, partial [Acidobacteria bacterium]
MGPVLSASAVLKADHRLSAPTPNQPTKILYVISDLSIGGAEMALYRLLSKTDRQRFEPVVVSLIDRGSLRKRIEDLGVEVYTLGLKAERPSPFALFRLVRLLKKLRPDLIVGWMQHSCLAAELANTFTRKRIPTIWSLHSILNSSLPEKKSTVLSSALCRLLSKLPSKIVLVSNKAQRQLGVGRYHADQSCVIPNGIE